MADIKKYKNDMHTTLCKIEETLFLLKDGKQILAYDKMRGIKEKLSLMYQDMVRDFDENNKDK